MKKRWFPFIVMCLVLGFLFGLQNGSAAEADRLQTRQEIQIFTQTAIAVVNADAGVTIDGEKKNYSAAIIEELGDEYTHVGIAVANKGFDDGAYGAVVVFPSDVSAKIWSFNSRQPEKVQLEFRVNPNLSEKDYIEIYTKILELQLSINTTLAYTYVSSIYQQFQLAQDQVDGIFKNDQSDLSALDIVMLKDFTGSLDLDELPDIPLETIPADTSSYFLSVTGFANDVSSRYLDSYGVASGRYLGMREGLFSLTDNFPQQEDDWVNDLSDWTTISVEYGELLEEYTAAVAEHEDELVAWYLQNVEWNEALREYQSDVLAWHESMREWFGDAGTWYETYQQYLDDAVKYMDTVADYHTMLVDRVDPILTDLRAWKELLEAYMQDLFDIFVDITQSCADYNSQADLANDLLEDLGDWYKELAVYYVDLVKWKVELEGWQTDLSVWQVDLSDKQTDLQTAVYDLDAYVTNLSPPPDQSDYFGDPLGYEEAMADWYDELRDFFSGLPGAFSLPDLSDLPDLNNLPALSGGPGNVPEPAFDLSDPSTPDPLKPLKPEWNNAVIDSPPPAYEDFGTPIPDELDTSDFPEPGLELPEMELDPPIDYEGSEEPAEVEEQPEFTVDQPQDPLVDPPPRPDGFWASLNLMHDQLSSFDVGEYLSDDIKQQVALLLNSYEIYLGTVRDDLSVQFDENILKLHDVQFGYSSYLSGLKNGALQAESAEQENLRGTLAEYAAIKEQNSEDTQGRLNSFANMMPESRSPAGLNRNLVSFTVAPFEFLPPALRPTTDPIQPGGGLPTTDPYHEYLWIAFWVACGVLLLTLASYILTYIKRK